MEREGECEYQQSISKRTERELCRLGLGVVEIRVLRISGPGLWCRLGFGVNCMSLTYEDFYYLLNFKFFFSILGLNLRVMSWSLKFFISNDIALNILIIIYEIINHMRSI